MAESSPNDMAQKYKQVSGNYRKPVFLSCLGLILIQLGSQI